MSSTLEASVFMGKNYSENLHSIKNTGKDLTFKTDVRHIWKVDNRTIRWDFRSCLKSAGKILHGNNHLWSMMKKSSVSRMQRFMYFQVNQEPSSKYCLGRTIELVQRFTTIHTIDGEPMEFEWNIFTGFTTLQIVDKVEEFMDKMGEPAQFQGRIIFMSMFNDIHLVIYRQWTGMHCQRHTCVFICKKMSSRTLVIPRTWIRKEVVFYLHWQTTRRMEQSRWIDDDQSRRKADTQFSEPRFHCPEERSKAREVVNYRYTGCADGDTIETVFRTIISVNQLSIYGAVSDLCKEYSACQTRTGRPVLARQSDPLFEPARLLITTPTPSIEIPAQENSLQKYKERVERLSLQDRVIKICTDAGFLITVEVGQYFMTKDTEEFSQFTEPMTCREYTLPRDEKFNWPKRLDSREHQNWTRVRSHNPLPAR